MTRDLPIPDQIDLWSRQVAMCLEDGETDGAAICMDAMNDIVYGDRPIHELLEQIEVA